MAESAPSIPPPSRHRSESAVHRLQCPDCGGRLARRRQPVTIPETYAVVTVLAIMGASAFPLLGDGGYPGAVLGVHLPTMILLVTGLYAAHTEKGGLLCEGCGKFRLPPAIRPQDRPGPWPTIVAAGVISLIYLFAFFATVPGRGTRGETVMKEIAGIVLVLLVLLLPGIYLIFVLTARRVWSSDAPPPALGGPLDEPPGPRPEEAPDAPAAPEA